ncbi:MAG: cyclic pyranopterin monophosphate synthase MoaC [SAR324 cluster bacterium]|jgi:cyclic pyranopterin phosphate synthase|nr:cyclic pyranopterin monophosphate synthase MoaC [Deltaproteobacteria bacterium]MDP6093766.1 cyclic pyranopterin monophosphate synthase MoaC [SAR324 cluster bacterium]MDP6245480.1 cyclic pyranopterin monophosphate synthase MoaC [SAR324 cluster bacterium]MDP6465064.1 cyclic pyranopterin monophosphate synthase MoaC [SAR324 cluster bacterium]MDP6638190.1 cyclic pyranopterin monophosphate synthase MoaC [SAR324 cluster bacterium]|tara:strand:+ start:2051 stop:2539 length:489 start_codon:yes stop_codon:yes gene_type:complete
MPQPEKNFTHLNEGNQPRMVDVSGKAVTHRTAVAEAMVHLGPELARMLKETGSTKKGPVIQTAVIAGIQGSKRTSDLIPMCHPLPLSAVEVDIQLEGEKARIQVQVKTSNQTGVEMEALTGASVAALTLYDMCKSISKAMIIESVRLLKKTGGKSGEYRADH